MQRTKPTIPSNYSRLIARELRLSGKRLPRLLRGTGLSRDQLLLDEQLLTPEQQIVILQNAISLASEPDFGLRLGQRLTPLSHGAMGFMAYSSPNLGMALRAIQTFLPTRLSFARLQLTERGSCLECAVQFDLPLVEDVRRCLAESMATMFFAVAEFVVGRRLHEIRCFFPHDAPDYHALYANYLPGGVHFSSEKLMITLPLALTRVPNASANHENYLLAMRQCEAMLADMRGIAQTYATRVKQLMLAHPPGTLSEDETAAELFVSKRTLARKLDLEQTSFRQIRDQLLAQQASDYLRSSHLTVDAIAALLNYHDSANFRRAFKRWFGIAPVAFRHAAKTH